MLGGFGSWDGCSDGTGTGGGDGGVGTPGAQLPSTQNFRREKRVSIRPTGACFWKEGSITVPVRLELGAYDSANVQLRVMRVPWTAVSRGENGSRGNRMYF